MLLSQKCCRSSKLSENRLKVRPPLSIQSPGPQQWGSMLDRWFCLFSSICLVWIELDSMSSGGLVRFPWVLMGFLCFFYDIDGCCSVSDGGLQKCRRTWWYCWFLKVIYTSSKMMLVGYDDVESKVMSIKCITTESSVVSTADAGPKPGCLIKWWALLRNWWCSSKMSSGMMI